MTRFYIAFTDPLLETTGGFSSGGALFPNDIVKHVFLDEKGLVIKSPDKFEFIAEVLKLHFSKGKATTYSIFVAAEKIRKLEITFQDLE